MAATLGATAALGLGLALARAGSGQLDARRRRRERRPDVLPGATPTERLRRIALAQADLALAELSSLRPDRPSDGELPGGKRTSAAVHEARKAIKRMRTAVRLLAGELGDERCALEDDALRRAGRGLSGTRDAEVMLVTLDRLLERHPRKLGGSRGIALIRRRLADERDAARRRILEDPAVLAGVTGELRAFRARAGAWPLSSRPGLGGAEHGLRRIYRQGRGRGRRAAKASPRRRTRAMHRWRKRVKDLRYAAEMLAQAQGRSDALARIAERADRLGETLGEDHDLAVLSEWASGHGKRVGAGREARRRLQGRIAKRRRKLRRRAFGDGKRLYRRPAKKFLARVERLYEREAGRLS